MAVCLMDSRFWGGKMGCFAGLSRGLDWSVAQNVGIVDSSPKRK
jgi:hypothetical protein